MDTIEAQHEIAEAVAERGYKVGWSDSEFAARQACKLVEEALELFANVKLPMGFNGAYKPFVREMADVFGRAMRCARIAFDDRSLWREATLALPAGQDEAADSDVVLANLAGCERASVGTCMEIGAAYVLQIPIVIVIEDCQGKKDYPDPVRKLSNPHDHAMLLATTPYVVHDMESALSIVRGLLA